MTSKRYYRWVCRLAAAAQAPKPKKVFIETDMEGTD